MFGATYGGSAAFAQVPGLFTRALVWTGDVAFRPRVEYVGRRVKPRDYTKVDWPTRHEIEAEQASAPELAIVLEDRTSGAIAAALRVARPVRTRSRFARENEERAAVLVAALLADDGAAPRYSPDNPFKP